MHSPNICLNYLADLDMLLVAGRLCDKARKSEANLSTLRVRRGS